MIGGTAGDGGRESVLIYLNEHDANAAQWLRNLIDHGTIPSGYVDCRDIKEVEPNDLTQYTQCHFFAGIAGWSLALEIAGIPEDFPVWTGSCPCQPFSSAGNQKGKDDERHLWPDFFNLIRECRPQLVFGEQVESAIRHGWIDDLQADVEGEGYALGYAVLGAHSVGAPHKRQRLFWGIVRRDRISELANSSSQQGQRWRDIRNLGDKESQPSEETREREWCGNTTANSSDRRCLANAESKRTSGLAETGKPDFKRNSKDFELGDSASKRRREKGNEEHIHGQQYQECGLVPLANSNGQRLSGRQEQDSGSFLDEIESSRWSDVSGCGGPDITVAYCRDGKFRPVSLESGNDPLAYGIPVELGRGEPKPRRMAIRSARTNRTTRLRGYGNAIVPAVAAGFVIAFMESLSDLT